MDYLTPTEVLVLHARLIQQTGRSRGVLDIGRLESALGRSQATFGGEELYPGLWGKAAALMHALLTNHPFVDSSKRTALTATGIFLELNGWSLVASNADAAELIQRVIAEAMAVDEIAAWLRSQCEANTQP